MQGPAMAILSMWLWVGARMTLPETGVAGWLPHLHPEEWTLNTRHAPAPANRRLGERPFNTADKPNGTVMS